MGEERRPPLPPDTSYQDAYTFTAPGLRSDTPADLFDLTDPQLSGGRILSFFDMTVEDIVEAHRDIECARGAAGSSATYDLQHELSTAYRNGLVVLIAERPDDAAAVLTILSDSEDSKELETAAAFLHDLAEFRPAEAIRLFEKLLDHPDDKIRGYARDSIAEAVERGHLPMEQGVRLLRIFRKHGEGGELDILPEH